MPARIYTAKDADPKLLRGKTIAVLGFGSQGHAYALNLRDSRLRVIIGLPRTSRSVPAARRLGFKVFETAEAVRWADVIVMALPDTRQGMIFNTEVRPGLAPGKTLVFLHGFAIHYKTVIPPKDVDVIMVAPKGPGPIVRRHFVEGLGGPALIAVHQDFSGKAKKTALSFAWGLGATRSGVFETTFAEETETDLFGEQVVLCGGVSALITAAYETLVEAGYQPEMAYFECLHELKLLADLIHESGISGMRSSISETAKWGDVTVGPRLIDSVVKKRMRLILRDIRSGKFARQWIREYQTGYKRYCILLAKGRKHPIERTGARLRALMPWIRKQAAPGTAKPRVSPPGRGS